MNDKIRQITEAKALAKKLLNIGPKCATELIRAGISSPEKLKKLGAKKAYLKILENGGFCGLPHAAYLYALEGAIRGCSWLNIPESKKQEYKKLTQDLRQKMK